MYLHRAARNRAAFNQIHEEIMDLITDQQDIPEVVVCPDGETCWDSSTAADAMVYLSFSFNKIYHIINGESMSMNESYIGKGMLHGKRYSAQDFHIWDDKTHHDQCWIMKMRSWETDSIACPCQFGFIGYWDGKLICSQEYSSIISNINIRHYVWETNDLEKIWNDHLGKDEWKDVYRRALIEGNNIICPHGLKDVLSGIDGNILYLSNDEFNDSKTTHMAESSYVILERIWIKYHKRSPKIVIPTLAAYITQNLVESGTAISNLNLKMWIRLYKMLPDPEIEHEYHAILMLCSGRSTASVEQILRYKGENDTFNDIYNLYGKVPEERVRLLSKSRSKEYISALTMIPLDVDLSKLSVAQTISACSRYHYDNVGDNQDIADIAFVVGLSQYDFDEFLNAWLYYKNGELKTHERIPSVGVVEKDGYIMYRLDHDDPRAMVLGHYTNCCQSFDGVGSTCVYHGIESQDGAFFVVEKRGKIIAQSWAWRNGNVVVFDNIEALSGDYMGTIAELYRTTATKLVGKLGITMVKVGAQYDKLGVYEYWAKCVITTPPEGVYSDAKNCQYIIVSDTKETYDYETNSTNILKSQPKYNSRTELYDVEFLEIEF